MSGAIEALYIYDEANRPILTHTYASRPLSAPHLLPLYLAHPSPRPSLIHLPNTSPPTLLFSLIQSNLLFLVTSSSEIEPLLVLEWMHRVVDIFEDFLGAPLLASRIEGGYDVVAQLLNEMCDGGIVSTTENNQLRDCVEVEGWLGKILGNINIPGKPGFASAPTPSSTSNMAALSSFNTSLSNNAAVPWRRANVRHTSNELYVDIIETLSIILAPSGRPLSAFAHGTIAFTSKISGVPDLLLSLSTPSGRHNIHSVMELPVFHPCVRLARWREAGELSFIPPDGRFVLAGYEVDLLPFTSGKSGSLGSGNSALKLPVSVEMKTSLGPQGNEFEVRLVTTRVSGHGNTSTSTFSRGGGSGGGLGGGRGGFGGSAQAEKTRMQELVVSVPIPADVRNISEIRVSKGDTTYNPGDKNLEWHLPTRDGGIGSATLRATVVGALFGDEVEDDGNGFGFGVGSKGTYDEGPAYQGAVEEKIATGSREERDARKVQQNRMLMPGSAQVSFSVQGWLPSGIKVESLVVDKDKSRGLGEGVKPYKGVKYLTVSRQGVEIRC